jgi:hypothetical protein
MHARAPINNVRIKCTTSRSSVQSVLLHSVGLKMQVAEHNELSRRAAVNTRSLKVPIFVLRQGIGGFRPELGN